MQAHDVQDAKAQKTAHVLLIDDESDILTVLKRSLDTLGIKSYGFTNSMLAVEHFKKNPDAYDIVITDIRMPQMSGFEVARAVKRVNPHVKIALMTAFEIHKNEVEMVLPSLEIDGLITKPIRSSAFAETINGILRR